MRAYRFYCPECDDSWSVLARDLSGDPRETCIDCGATLDVTETEVDPYA